MGIFKDEYEVNKLDGVATVTYKDEKAFKAGTDITADTLKKVFDYASEYINEATEAAAAKATSIMEKDKSIDKVFVNFPYGVSKRGGVNVVAKRSQTYPNMKDPSTPIVKSAISVAVKDPLSTVGKSKVRQLSDAMTATLLS